MNRELRRMPAAILVHCGVGVQVHKPDRRPRPHGHGIGAVTPGAFVNQDVASP